MRAALSLIALAASALGAHIPRVVDKALYDRGYGGDHDDKGKGGKDKGGHDVWETVTTRVIVTYTTVCPVTDTVTKPGNTYTTTYTTTSTVETAVPTTVVVTKTAPPVTKTEGEGKDSPGPGWLPGVSLTIYRLAVVYTTLTELCPVTETKVVGGSTVEVTWTSTSTVVTKVAKTETVYTTSVVTEYETTDVYETVCRSAALTH